MQLYKNIHTLRVINGLSQEKMAMKLGMNQTYYSRIENELVDLPVSYFVKISELFNVPVDTLLFVDLNDRLKGNKE